MSELDFSAWRANLLKPVVDKDQTIAWFNIQLEEWEREAARPDDIAFAPQAIEAIKEAVERVDAVDERVWDLRRARHSLSLAITDLETAVDDGVFDVAADLAERIVAGIKRLEHFQD